MSTVSEYRKKTRKQLTLPSGLKFEVRPFVVSDFAEAGSIPQGFLEGNAPKAQAEIVQNPRLLDNVIKAALLNCVYHIPEDGNPRITIVDKKPDDCAENELSYRELTQDDSNILWGAAMSQSIPTKEVAEKAKPFPGEATAP